MTKKDTSKEIPVETYSIGMLRGESPWNLKSNTISNPIISRKDFEGEEINFVADPFGYFKDDRWFLFYESMAVGSRKGKICVSQSSDLQSWTRGEVILEEPFHLSYPQIFEFDDELYMVPETYEKGEIRLYRCTHFPLEWKFEKVLLPIEAVDSTLLQCGNQWWMFVCDTPKSHDRLRLYYSDDLKGEWTEHPQSPIYPKNNQNSRSAGKVMRYGDKIFRFAQDCSKFYGECVRAFEIEELNVSFYKEREIEMSPLIGPGSEFWNCISMHHLDVHKLGKMDWIAFVDGRRN